MSAAILGLQRTVGNQAVSGLLSHLQRSYDARGSRSPIFRQTQVAESADIEEVPITQDQQVSQNDDNSQSQDDDSQSVQALHATGYVQRDGDIPPPPPAFPAVSSWLLSQSIVDATNEAWGMTCSDGLERAFVIMWHERTGNVWPNEVVIGSHDRVRTNIPADRPPVYPVGHFHTHPKPTPGYTRTPGPSSIDTNDAATNHLPHAVEDFVDKTFDCRKAGEYMFGPSIRTG